MRNKIFLVFTAITIATILFAAGLAGTPPPPRKPMYMNFQQLVVYNSKGTNEYYITAHSTDQSTRPGVLDTMNVHALLEFNDGEKKTIDNEDLKIACLGNMYNKVIGQKNTLFRFNLIIDNSGSIDSQSLGYVQNSLTKFIKLIPLVFEAQVIKFADGVQLKTKFSKDKESLINAINQPYPQGGTALFDAIDVGVQELKYLGDEVPLRFCVVLTDGRDNNSKRNPNAQIFKNKIVNECKKLYIPMFIVGVTNGVDKTLLQQIAGFGFYKHIQGFPDIDKAFQIILNLIKDTYIIKIPAIGNYSNLKTIYLVKRTPGGNVETIQDFIVR